MEWAYEKANRTNVKENIELLLKILEEAEFNQEWINEYKQICLKRQKNIVMMISY